MNESDYKIFHDDSWEPQPRKKTRVKSFPFERMKPGDYFFVPVHEVDEETLRNRVNQSAMRSGCYYHMDRKWSYRDGPQGIPCFRIFHDGYRWEAQVNADR